MVVTLPLHADNSPVKHFLIKFNVTGVNGQALTNAKLCLYNTDAASAGGDFHHVSDDTWQEETITWTNAPTADTQVLASLGQVSINTWYEVNLTSLITGDGTYSLRISDSVGGADYSSKEGTNAPTQTPTPGPSPTPTIVPTATATQPPPPAAFNNATFVYDGDGRRVKSIFNNNATTTYFVGTHYEVTNPGANQTITKYYYAGSQRIAMRTNGTLNYLLGDHLGSTSLVTDSAGNKINEQRYKAWGETRYTFGNEKTKYQYTGQYSYASDFGLHFYNARWYDSSLGRFTSADSITPGGIQGMDRYAYVNNSPVNYVDPSGHLPCLSCSVLAMFGKIRSRINEIRNAPAITVPRTSVPNSPSDTTAWLINELNTNAASEYAQEMSSQGLADASETWVSLVRPGAIWDFKPDLRKSSALLPDSKNVKLGADYETHYEALANINLGYVGAAAGFNGLYLQAGAGAFQEAETQGPITTGFDDPYDNYWIKFGIYLYRTYGQDGLTEDEFQSGLDYFLEKYGDPGKPIKGKDDRVE